MSKFSFHRIFLNSVTGSLSRTVRAIDFGMIAINALLSIIDINQREIETIDLRILIGFHIIFLLLSLTTPLQQPLWKRRIYVFLCMSLISSPIFLGIDFKLLMYWWIAKSCLLLPRIEVLLTVACVGIIYMSGAAWIIPSVYEQMLADIAQKGARAVLRPQSALIGSLLFYLGASSFAVILGFLLLSERQSRQRTEMLSQQVEILATALERARIARDIHDSLGHTLTGLGIQLEAVQKLQQRYPEQAQRSLLTAQHLTDQCLQDVRRSLSTLRDSNFNLNEAVAALIEQSQYQGFNIRLDFRLPQLPLQMSHQIYCIVREGLMNVQKHAHATEVSLVGSSCADMLVLELKDNGRGFDLAQSKTGFGVRGMQERVQILHGHFMIESTLGQGTWIKITIPV
jgi:signal transduction histidine kinase